MLWDRLKGYAGRRLARERKRREHSCGSQMNGERKGTYSGNWLVWIRGLILEVIKMKMTVDGGRRGGIFCSLASSLIFTSWVKKLICAS